MPDETARLPLGRVAVRRMDEDADAFNRRVAHERAAGLAEQHRMHDVVGAHPLVKFARVWARGADR